MPAWSEFEQERQARAEQEKLDRAQSNPLRDRYYELCAVVFAGGNGADLLKMMRAMTIERRSRPAAHEAHLREDEAVRRFVADLELARDRGSKLLADKSKPKA